MNSPRILVITGEYPPMRGGIADYTALLNVALEQHDVEPIIMSGEESSADVLARTWSWRTFGDVRDAIQRLNVDLVHIQYQAGAFRMHPALNLLPYALAHMPIVTTFHDLRPPYLFPKAGRLRYAAMKRMARGSRIVIVTNPRDQEIFASARIQTVRIPIGPSIPAPSDDIQPGQEIGYFGFPSRQKGFDQLVKALGQIPTANRPALRIVGGQPPAGRQHGFLSIPDVETLAETYCVSIRWTGFLQAQAASDALAACAAVAFAFPGGATQRSSALIAALQTGRPVITTAPYRPSDLNGLSHLPQLIQVERDDIVALASALGTSLNSSTNWSAVPAEYAWSSIGARHASLYQSILREARH